MGTQASAMVFRCPEVRPRVLPALGFVSDFLGSGRSTFFTFQPLRKGTACDIDGASHLDLCCVSVAWEHCQPENISDLDSLLGLLGAALGA